MAKDDLTVGGVIAAGIVMQAHGEDVIAEEILRNFGVTTIEKARALGVDEYDINILRPVFAEMTRRDQTKRSLPAQGALTND